MKPLSPREKEIVLLRIEGRRIHEIAQQVGIAHGTVQRHLGRIREHTGDFDPYGPGERLVVALLAEGALTVDEVREAYERGRQ